ncbi:single-stranded DNA-binding protein [Bacillus bombysepticus]|uniref:single-stranded DNA-binding protein n=1 Tax=Bacillus bombysepticus TaxID=658666 RepID=UPI0030173626
MAYNIDRNYVVVSGTVGELPEVCTYLPRPLVSFDLQCFRKKKASEDEAKSDIFRIVMFDCEDLIDDVKEGDRILVKGELQTRNYMRPFTVTEEYVINAVRNYYEVFDEIPSQKPVEGRKRAPISFKKLFEQDFIPRLPQDSMFNEEDIKEKTEDRYYIYTVDENGDVYKEIEQVAYEILTSKYELLEEPTPTKGDVNFVELLGTPIPPYNFTFRGEENPVPFLSFKVKTKSRFFKEEDRFFYTPIICWSQLAESNSELIEENKLVHIKGRLQTRTFEREIRVKWITEFGNIKKAKKPIEHIVREVSASKIDYPVIEDFSNKTKKKKHTPKN